MKTIFTIVFTVLALNAQAQHFTCRTPRENKVFKVGPDTVTFIDTQGLSSSRELASMQKVQTQKSGNGFTKTLWLNGQKHIIHIADQSAPSEVDDYIILRSRQGHEVIYPLNCSKN